MQTSLKKSADPLKASADLLVVPVAAPSEGLSGPAAALDAALGGLVSACVADGEIDGAAGSATVLHTRGATGGPRAVVVGVGDGGAEGWRRAGGAAGRCAGKLKAGTVALAPGDAGAAEVHALVTGFAEGEYRFDAYRTGEKARRPRVRALAVHSGAVKAGDVRRAGRLAEAVAVARDLGNTPSNDLTPARLAARARELSEGVPGLTCTVLGRAQLTRLRAGGILGVARGSAEEPRMIVMRYRPEGLPGGGPVLGLVGKAVTFDTGGISIKPSNGMEEMKLDMAGGAAVIAAAALIARMGLPVEVAAVVPATENMPSGTAIKPGDVIRAMNGTTIEVTNTDAEGRLILADALCYATSRCGATHLVDLATLTGAIVVALGEVYAGLFGGDAAWTERVRAAGESSGDLCWPMPMHPGYDPLIESKVADLSNSSPKRQAGAVYAAQFLRAFTDGRPWCHLDVAGTAMVNGAATGFGVALLMELAESLAAEAPAAPARAAGGRRSRQGRQES